MAKDRGQAEGWDFVAAPAARDLSRQARRKSLPRAAKAGRAAVEAAEAEDMVGEDGTCSIRRA